MKNANGSSRNQLARNFIYDDLCPDLSPGQLFSSGTGPDACECDRDNRNNETATLFD